MGFDGNEYDEDERLANGGKLMPRKMLPLGAIVIVLAITVVGSCKPTRTIDEPAVLCVGEVDAEGNVECLASARKCKGPIMAGVYGGAPGHTATATCGAVVATCTVKAGSTTCFDPKAGPAEKADWGGCAGGGGATNVACGYVDP